MKTHPIWSIPCEIEREDAIIQAYAQRRDTDRDWKAYIERSAVVSSPWADTLAKVIGVALILVAAYLIGNWAPTLQ